MKFASVLLVLVAMSASTVLAAPHKNGKAEGPSGKAVRPKAKAGKGSKADGAAKAAAAAVSAGAAAGAVKNAKDKSKNQAKGNQASDSSVTNSTDNAAAGSNSTGVDNSEASNAASSTATAAGATRTRPCDQGDQSLAAGLNAAVVIGLGLQASVATLQNISSQAQFAAKDFADGVTRLQQFQDTMGLQLQVAQAIADDDSFAQTQLKLLAAAQTATSATIKSLSGVASAAQAKSAANTLSALLNDFLTTTNTAQDGASQALIDCFLPLTTVSG
ncbi:hypothetical protein MIND_00197100 [Mycena indigotica]|uniref:Uncharacterized protein n=1 Tax=Mycena indigotica TaxID=2126181 RepID=A0A8H6T503_9AGAR|nr:uncharacterized protein MIND_00197100 [Mycena indigotica]KAF7311863.1 hypothetical protein MIND_00197100 [Mycena indigotica]